MGVTNWLQFQKARLIFLDLNNTVKRCSFFERVAVEINVEIDISSSIFHSISLAELF